MPPYALFVTGIIHFSTLPKTKKGHKKSYFPYLSFCWGRNEGGVECEREEEESYILKEVF